MSIVLQVRSNGQITLPTSIRRQVDLKEGDILEVIVEEDGSLRLIPKVAIDRSQAYFWTERWQQGERQADQDLKAGRFLDFETMDEFIHSLEDQAEAK
jgi:AbrB family looped-hinge helix DNA binding protein